MSWANFLFQKCASNLVALCINKYLRSSSQFQKGWWPLYKSLTNKVFLADTNVFHFSTDADIFPVFKP